MVIKRLMNAIVRKIIGDVVLHALLKRTQRRG